MTLLHPVWLLLALAVPAIWFVPRRLRDVRLGLLRSLVLLLVVLGAARPVAWTSGGPAWHAIVLGAGLSVDEATREGALREARALAGRLPAGTRTVLVTAGSAAPEPDFDRSIGVVGLTGFGDLSRALEAAARAIPDGARGAVTLFSDGRGTDRRWARATQQLTARGIPVHAIELPGRQPRAELVGLEVPEVLRVGAQARILVRLEGRGATGRVRLMLHGADEDPVDEVTTDPIALDGPQTLAIPFEPSRAGFFHLNVNLRVDGEPTVRHLHREVAVQDPLRVLYLGERMAEGGPNLASLVGPGFHFQTPRDEGDAPFLVSESDVVVLDDVPADRVPSEVQEAIRDAVADGATGLFMTGGRAAFGAGGWQRSPLAATLPIEMIQKEEKRDPSTTLVVIIDTSGSMGGNRVQLAKEVARLAIRRLLPHDKVGIVEFYGAKRWAAPIQPASNAIEIQRALNRLNAGGGTVIMPAIEEAFYGLQNVQTRYKHVLVLTDGGVETGAFEPLLRRMAEKGITVSTVLIGGQTHSEFLVNLANWGKGRFYGVPNRFNLPEILLKQPASAHLPPWRPGTHALDVHGGAGWWGDIDTSAVPAIAGYVEARVRPGATALLKTRAAKHPVLATWRYGVGRATALLTEPTGPGTAPWSTWKDYGEMLGRVLARTASDMRRAYRFHVDYRDGEAIVVARQMRTDAMPPQGELVFDQGNVPLDFRRRAPDLYEAATAGWYGAANALVGTALDTPWRLAIPPEERRAYEMLPEDALDLEALAAATGGSYRPFEQLGTFVPAAGAGDAPVDVVPLWPWCLLLALLAWMGELTYRRWPRRGGVQ